ncbi:MAG: 4Fe-4S dicluster domain-containing protein [Thermodesulfobacteriota bacterium]
MKRSDMQTFEREGRYSRNALEVRAEATMKRLKGIRVQETDTGDLTLEPKRLPSPPRVVIPLEYPQGSVEPLVGAGDTVREGQCIARDENGILPDVRASIAGKVSAIKPWPGPFGCEYPSIMIESNGSGGEPERLFEEGLTPQDLRTQLRMLSESGIREADVYPWPLSVRIAQPSLTPPVLFPFVPHLRRPIDYLILNGVDRQPGVMVRNCALKTLEDEILAGIPFLKALTGAPNTILALSSREPLSEALERGLRMAGVETAFVPDRYPMGLEAVLVQHVTGREIPQPEGDARSVGAVVVDVCTVAQVAEVLLKGRLQSEALVQISAPSQWIHTFVRVREGTLLEDALEHLSPAPKDPARLICGGPFLGHAMYGLQVPLIQQTEAVFFQAEGDFAPYEDEPCINCGRCVQSCPMRLFPNELSRACEYERFDEAEKNDLFRCIECGICSFVCPVRRPMVHLIRFGKHELSASREEQ